MAGKLIVCASDYAKNDDVYRAMFTDVLGAGLEGISFFDSLPFVGDASCVLICGSELVKQAFGEDVALTQLMKGGVMEYEGVNCLVSGSYGWAVRSDDNLRLLAKQFNTAYNLAFGITEQRHITEVEILLSMEAVHAAVAKCVDFGTVAFDFETTGLEWHNKDKVYPTLLSLSYKAGHSYILPLFHAESSLDAKEVIAYVNEHIFSNKDVRKIAHNLKFDMHIAIEQGCNFSGRLDDTMLMHHLLDENAKHGLKEIVANYFPYAAGYDVDVAKYKWDEVPLSVLAPYAAMDTDFTFRLAAHFEHELLRDERLYKIYRNQTIPALKAFVDAEHRGMLIDREYLENAAKEVAELIESVKLELKEHPTVRKFELFKRKELLAKELARLEEKLEAAKQKADQKYIDKGKDPATRPQAALEIKYADNISAVKAGVIPVYEDGVNLSSPTQLSELLYSKKGFDFEEPFADKTAKKTLKELPDDSGFIENLMLLRSLEKTYTTYILGILDKLDANNNVHTSFLQHGTTSGRLSSKDPNLQNIPDSNRVKNERAKAVAAHVKKAFIAPKGYVIAQYDYSQAELRIVAEFADEKNMLQAYEDGKDLHAVTATKLLGLANVDDFYALPADVQKQARTKAKSANFGLLYGMGAEGYQRYAKDSYGIEMSLKEAEDARNSFFQLYPNLLKYHRAYISKARKFGYVRTLYGRKRRLLNIKSLDSYKASQDERIAINMPIQGTGGEFTIFAIALLQHRLHGLRAYFVNTVHDSIVFYIHQEDLKKSHKIIKHTCENLPTLEYFGKELSKVSMKVDAEISYTNWKELQEFSL